ncbi:Os05g0382101 [Oryza sativa Japonica Group]|uniref:Os05g0382101 protein n=1 Tax=Oryza sativa subsp. japonica TaxID=39947 RepID=A0A0P0WLM8_ORYSJ|nr:Os05g0382101 [Oryza sativa Japonica Group]
MTMALQWSATSASPTELGFAEEGNGSPPLLRSSSCSVGGERRIDRRGRSRRWRERGARPPPPLCFAHRRSFSLHPFPLRAARSIFGQRVGGYRHCHHHQPPPGDALLGASAR